jgi:hypothetical protein
MKCEPVFYVSECDTCRKVKADYMKPGGLVLGHWARACRNPIRCRFSFVLGHIARLCRKKAAALKGFWRPISASLAHLGGQESGDSSKEISPPSSPIAHESKQHQGVSSIALSGIQQSVTSTSPTQSFPSSTPSVR